MIDTSGTDQGASNNVTTYLGTLLLLWLRLVHEGDDKEG